MSSKDDGAEILRAVVDRLRNKRTNDTFIDSEDAYYSALATRGR